MKKQIYLLLGLLFLCMISHAQSYSTHALYIYSFSKHITWPDQESEEYFKIGVVGESAIVAPLQKMASLKKVNNQIVKIMTFGSVDEIQDCNILFLPLTQSGNFAKVMEVVGDRSILLITEKDGLGDQGSCINFVMKDKRLMFEINNDAINKANLEVAAELKKFAILL